LEGVIKKLCEEAHEDNREISIQKIAGSNRSFIYTCMNTYIQAAYANDMPV